VQRLLDLPIVDHTRLTEPGSIYDFLAAPHPESGLLPVRLLRASWLLKRADEMESVKDDPAKRRLLALPRRQDLPEEAFIAADEVRALQPRSPNDDLAARRVAVVAVSYCWFTREHPDPDGDTLLALADALKQLAAKKGTGAFLQNPYALWPEEYGVFLDWCSAHQKDADGNRSDAEQKSLKRALDNLDLFYAHAWPTTVMLTNLAVERAYHDRGWPSFEYAVSSLLKGSIGYLWNGAIDVGSQRSPLAAAPRSPAIFAEDLQTKVFTNGKADADAVLELYEKTVALGFRGSSRLEFSYREWTEDDMVNFVPLLQLCRDAQKLDFSKNSGLRGRGLAALANQLERGALPRLQELAVAINQPTHGKCCCDRSQQVWIITCWNGDPRSWADVHTWRARI